MSEKILQEIGNLKTYRDLLCKTNDMDTTFKYFECDSKLNDKLQEELEKVDAVIDTLENLMGD